ncbi:hypothetical protein SLS62_002421 [Diatrype stigma]|uniref:LysM domain-containing protein n=1 Tax=Diatrype stigma TaxID=117547 RepID=A0AAN9UXR9_9PEZI
MEEFLLRVAQYFIPGFPQASINMLKTLTSSLTALLVLLASPGLALDPPGLVQPGSDFRVCSGWTLASPGDSCYSLSKPAGLSIDAFLALNPQLKHDCRRLWAGYHYCIRAAAAPAPTQQRLKPPGQAPVPVKTRSPPPHGPITPAPAVTSCVYDDCYNQFEINGKMDPRGVTALCDAYQRTARTEKDPDPARLFASLPKPSPAYWWPDHITRMCTGDAHLYMSSLCRCFTSAPFTASLGEGHSV